MGLVCSGENLYRLVWWPINTSLVCLGDTFYLVLSGFNLKTSLQSWPGLVTRLWKSIMKNNTLNMCRKEVSMESMHGWRPIWRTKPYHKNKTEPGLTALFSGSLRIKSSQLINHKSSSKPGYLSRKEWVIQPFAPSLALFWWAHNLIWVPQVTSENTLLLLLHNIKNTFGHFWWTCLCCILVVMLDIDMEP